jgi:hypothetical protein
MNALRGPQRRRWQAKVAMWKCHSEQGTIVGRPGLQRTAELFCKQRDETLTRPIFLMLIAESNAIVFDSQR